MDKIFLLLLLAAPLQAQSLGSTLLGKYDEQVVGAVGNLALRGPWVQEGWRKPLPRTVLFTTLSFLYERFGDVSHNTKWDANARRDFMGREVGYLLTEGVIALYLTIRHKQIRL